MSKIPKKSLGYPSLDPNDSPLDDDPKQKQLIINTLINLKNNGKSQNTLNSVNRNLTRISRHADLTKPEEVKQYIADAKRLDNRKPLSSQTKSKLVFC